MKKSFLKNMLIAAIVATTFTSFTPLVVSAETTNSTSYTTNTGWVQNNGKWYYYDSSGVMQTGVVETPNGTYCLNPSGVMETGDITVNGQPYYTCPTGGFALGDLPKVDKEFDSNNNLITDNNKLSVCGVPLDINGLPQLPQNYSIYVKTDAEDIILKLMNEKRVEAGLQPLVLDNTLIQVARYKSDHMVQYGYFDHTNPDGTTWINWLNTIGYNYNETAENIVSNTYDAVEFFNQWWNSPGHKVNMMNPEYTKVGIGVVQGNNQYMGTQEFSN